MLARQLVQFLRGRCWPLLRDEAPGQRIPSAFRILLLVPCARYISRTHSRYTRYCWGRVLRKHSAIITAPS